MINGRQVVHTVSWLSACQQAAPLIPWPQVCPGMPAGAGLPGPKIGNGNNRRRNGLNGLNDIQVQLSLPLGFLHHSYTHARSVNATHASKYGFTHENHTHVGRITVCEEREVAEKV